MLPSMLVTILLLASPMIASAQIATAGFEEMTYTFTEGTTGLACVAVMSGSIPASDSFQIGFGTIQNTALIGSDYPVVQGTLTLTSTSPRQCISVPIIADGVTEPTESFTLFIFDLSNDPDFEVVASAINAQIFITDSAAPPPSTTTPTTDPITTSTTITPMPVTTTPSPTTPPPATMPSGGGDDPHFSVILPSGKMLCFTVQGEHGFSFNLISNKFLHMNALFVPDSHRSEVTWMGQLGIVVRGHTDSYNHENKTRLKFDAKKSQVSIGERITLDAKHVKNLVFVNGKLIISEREATDGKYIIPSVDVQLLELGLHFTVKFHSEHLDIYWNRVGVQVEQSHGLIGQFFRKGVKIDPIRKFLVLPNKDPVPVMRRPVWSFMERHVRDDQLCWTAMNPGYQGDGLIDGHYLDYMVDSILSDNFVFKNRHH